MRIMKKLILITIIVFLLLSLISCIKENAQGVMEDNQREELTIAAGTTLQDSGFLDAFIPQFEKRYAIDVKVIATGSGQAIEYAKNGDVDLLLIHSPDAEQAFVDAGYGLKRTPVMHNYFYLVGPQNLKDVFSGLDIYDAFQEIHQHNYKFISRGDQSGTHIKELAIWKKLGIAPTGEVYISAGASMASVLEMTDQMSAITLVDQGSYVKLRKQFDLALLIDDTEHLINPYSLVTLNSNSIKGVNSEGADLFVEWLLSDEIQLEISNYGVEPYGSAVYFSELK